jgi:phospholipid/cholesterol/gamma-HCH transport system ATP-binding protein
VHGKLRPSFIAIIVLNFFFAQLLKDWYLTIYGVRSLFGSAYDMAFIELRNVYKRFGSLVVLHELTSRSRRGSRSSSSAQSGTGKSVMLKHIVGLLRPDTAKCGSTAARSTPAGARAGRRAHALRFPVPDGRAVRFAHRRGERRLPASSSTRTSRRTRSRRSSRTSSSMSACPSGPKMPGELSGGQKKRVALARAIALDPEVILYDEPTTGLDPIRSDVINELILKLQRELKVTSIVVTHDMNSAFKVADRIVMLHEGHIIFDGTPEQIQTSENPDVKRFVQGEAGETELATLNL